MLDISKVFDTLDSKQQALLLEKVAGKNRANVLAAILQNADQLENAYDTLSKSAGSAEKEQTAYMNSLSGRINALKESVVGLSIQMTDSDFLKGFIGNLTSGVNIIGVVIDKFGAIPTAIAIATASLVIFNSKFREMSNSMLQVIPGYGRLSNSLNVYSDNLKLNIASIKSQINILRQQQAEALKTGESTVGLGKKMLKLNANLALTTASMVAARIASIALSVVLSMGLSFAITAAIGGITALGKSLFGTGKTMDDCSESAKTLATSLNEIKSGEDLVSQYEKLNNKLKDINLTAEEREGIESEIESVRKQLATDDAFYWVLNSEKDNLESQLALMKEIQKQRLLENAEELDKDMPSQRKMGNTSDQLSLDVAQWKELDEAIRNADASGMTMYKGHSVEAKNLMSIQDEVKDRINKSSLEIKNYNGQLKVMGDVGYETSRSEVKLSDSVETTLGAIKKETEALEENTKSKEDNSNAVSGSEYTPVSVEDATKSYVEAAQKATELHNIIEAINKEQAMTPDLMAKMSDYYGELGSKITDAGEVQELLNSKIREQVKTQEEMYAIMIGDDEEYYATRLQNANELQGAFDSLASIFVDVNSDGYDFDVKNFKTLNEAKNALGNSLNMAMAQWISNMVGGNAEGYAKDLNNMNELAEKKTYLIKKMTEQMDVLQNNMNRMMGKLKDNVYEIDSAGNGTTAGAKEHFEKLANEYANLNANLQKVDEHFNVEGSFEGHTPSFGNTSVGGGGGSGSNNSNSSSQAEKDWKDSAKLVEDLTDRYYDLNNAVNDYNELLAMNKAKQELATGEEKIKLMEEEIRLIETKKQAIQNLINEQTKERDGLKNSALLQELKYDADGDITNRNDILNNKRNYANNLNNFASEEARQNYLDYIDAMEQAIKRYEELNKVIPENKLELEGLNSTIKDIYKTQRDLVADQEQKMADMIKYYAEKKTEAKKEQVEKELELEKKRIEGLKKSLSEEKELYNKEISEDNYESDLAKERNKLAQIQAEIDRLSLDNSARGKAQLADMLKQFETQQSLINDKIKEHQQNATNDRFDDEMDLLDKELESTEDKYQNILDELDKQLEEYLSPESLNGIISNALKSGMVDIMGVTVDVQSAMADMINATTVGFISANTSVVDYIESLKEVMSVYDDMSNINLGANFNASQLNGAGTGRGVTVTTGDLIIQGDVNKDTLPDLQRMFDEHAKTIYKNIYNQLK